tara:strand:+ start:10376 stop:12457 length:2082 start_codon:yes stop_codon:yes gene_type:complete
MVVKVNQSAFTGGIQAPTLVERTDIAKYAISCKDILNAVVRAHGGVFNRAGTKFIAEIKDSTVPVRLVPFQFDAEQSYVLEFGDEYMRIIKEGEVVLDPGDSSIAEIVSPYTADQIGVERLKYTQSADVMKLCNPAYAPHNLKRLDHHDWEFEAETFVPNIDAPSGVTVSTTSTGTKFTYSYIVTAVAENGEESVGSSSVSITTNYKHGQLNSSNQPSGEITIDWNAVAGADKYNVYLEYQGIYGWLAEIDASETEYSYWENWVPNVADTPQVLNNPFDGAGKYPAVVSIYEQRVVFCRTDNAKESIFMTRAGRYNNMNVSEVTRADDAIEYVLSGGSQVNEIRGLAELNDLIILTSGGLYKANGKDDERVSPDTFKAKRQNKNGASHLQPFVIGESLVYNERNKKTYREIDYDAVKLGYSGRDLTLLAEHLFEDAHVVDHAWQEIPDKVLWCVMSDGTLLGMTYMKEHEIFAWHRHNTDGEFESVCCVTEGNYDAVYFVVKREIDGQTKRYIERLEERIVRNVEDCYFVDCGLSYDGEETDTVTGLDHLEGKTVSILADGNVMDQQVVTGGQIQISVPASKIHVGLPYISDVVPHNFELNGEKGTTKGVEKNIRNVFANVYRTRGLWIGTDEDNIYPYKQRTFEDLGDPIELYTGIMEQEIDSDWEKNGDVLIRQIDPLPFEILGLTLDLDV